MHSVGDFRVQLGTFRYQTTPLTPFSRTTGPKNRDMFPTECNNPLPNSLKRIQEQTHPTRGLQRLPIPLRGIALRCDVSHRNGRLQSWGPRRNPGHRRPGDTNQAQHDPNHVSTSSNTQSGTEPALSIQRVPIRMRTIRSHPG